MGGEAQAMYFDILTFHVMFIEIDIEEERKRPCVNVV